MPDVAALGAWIEQFLPASVDDGQLADLAPLAGDAGFRCYYRLNTSPSLIGVLAPPEHENNPAFVAKGLALRKAGVHVPQIHGVDFSRGFLLLEDLGDDLFLPLLNPGSVDGLYGAAEQTLHTVQQTPAAPTIFPDYSETLLRNEMALFPEWFVGKLLGLELDSGEVQLLEETFACLVSSALAQPQVVVHRDYHSRNLLLMADGAVGVVDFQDAVTGPFTYDLVSLLKDCYIRWPTALVRERALGFLREAWRHHGEGGDQISDDRLLGWFDLMGLQRHIKVLGIFARLWLRDGKSRYLDDLPLVLRYTLEVTQHNKEFEHFNQWFNERLLPAIVRQPWYRPWQQAGD